MLLAIWYLCILDWQYNVRLTDVYSPLTCIVFANPHVMCPWLEVLNHNTDIVCTILLVPWYLELHTQREALTNQWLICTHKTIAGSMYWNYSLSVIIVYGLFSVFFENENVGYVNDTKNLPFTQLPKLSLMFIESPMADIMILSVFLDVCM